jgi:hypothetical protein
MNKIKETEQLGLKCHPSREQLEKAVAVFRNM